MSGSESGSVSKVHQHDSDSDTDSDPEGFHASQGAPQANGKLLPILSRSPKAIA